eukprot:gb/GFBE01022978.1/.p1 GENE.gb/GFBE01022978.1/~~gb/GFBE01022978.1/.p1  ORF type:complete len:441 (+),score=87.23 gb/GFBE01022978.1/:1-1323(+)
MPAFWRVPCSLLFCSLCAVGIREESTDIVNNDEGFAATHATPLTWGKQEKDFEGLLGRPFSEFSVQCSHNTYIDGRQAALQGTVDAVRTDTMGMALDLGYRCIEIDAWQRNEPRVLNETEMWTAPSDGPTTSWAKVTHRMWGEGPKLANEVDFSLFIKAILEWLKADESDVRLRLPLTISLEKHCKVTECEEYLATFFRQLGDRLVRPAAFKPGITMRELAGPKRKVILKSSAAMEGSSLEELIAMVGFKKEKPVPEGQLLSKSIAMDSEDGEDQPPAIVEKVNKSLHEGMLVRTYPGNLAYSSRNYRTRKLFEVGAQMVCINIQGLCFYLQDRCPNPIRGKMPEKKTWKKQVKGWVRLVPRLKRNQDDTKSCRCERDTAASVEKAFATYGYDGYVHLPSVGEGFYNMVDEAARTPKSGGTVRGKPDAPPQEPEDLEGVS